MENAKKNLVFHFEGGRHASFPQKPVVKEYIDKENLNNLNFPNIDLMNSISLNSFVLRDADSKDALKNTQILDRYL